MLALELPVSPSQLYPSCNTQIHSAESQKAPPAADGHDRLYWETFYQDMNAITLLLVIVISDDLMFLISVLMVDISRYDNY